MATEAQRREGREGREPVRDSQRRLSPDSSLRRDVVLFAILSLWAHSGCTSAREAGFEQGVLKSALLSQAGLPPARLHSASSPVSYSQDDSPLKTSTSRGPAGGTFAVQETHEALAISQIELDTRRADRSEEQKVRLVQVGNPIRRPPLPDLSRDGEFEFPGRVSLEVPNLGLACRDRWVPPGIYRLSLVVEDFETKVRARPLAPGPVIDLPVESGILNEPAERFRAYLGVREVDLRRLGYLSIRWGILMVETTLQQRGGTGSQGDDWTLEAVPVFDKVENEIFLGRLSGGPDGSGLLEARWILGNSQARSRDSRLRLERASRRRLFAFRRECRARAERLRTIIQGSNDQEIEKGWASLAESYEALATQLTSQLNALTGSNREIEGKTRAPQGDTTTVELLQRTGETWLTIDSPTGGAEFRLP